MYKKILPILLASSLTACAWNPQAVVITPTVSVSSKNIGNGRPVTINVVDERPQNKVGMRGAGGVGGELSVQGDLATVIQDTIADGMERQGFGRTDSSRKSELRVEIRSLSYEVITGLWEGTLNINMALKAICVRNGQSLYEKMYRGEYKEGIQIAGSEVRNNELVSVTVSRAVNALLADKSLMKCLAR